MTIRYVRIVLYLIIMLHIDAGVGAHPDSTAEFARPKVGLVLSSGGARGLAHIGVLKAFEEFGIPVDYISGSSMGSMVGGLYACGYTPNELDSLVRSIDWMEIFEGSPLRCGHKPLQRQREFSPLFRVDLGSGRVRIPKSLFSTYRVNKLLFRLTIPSNFMAGCDFNRLPIPFRVVTVDMRTGTREIIKNGSLARAIRASTSIPVLFPPVEMDGKTLVDGGMLDNLPTDVMRDWDTEVILGVNVSSDLPIMNSTYNLIDVGRQVIKLWMIVSDRQRRVKPSLVIRPDLGNHSPLAYGKIDWLIQKGYEAAVEKMDSISILVGNLGKKDGKRPGKTFSWQDLKRYKIARVVLRGNKGTSASFILNRFSVRSGEPVDCDAIEKGTDNLWATNLFREVWIDLLPVNKDKAEVVLHVSERDHRSLFLSGTYQNDKASTVQISLMDENLFKNAERLSLGFKWGKLYSIGNFIFQKDNLVGSSFFLEARGKLGVERAIYYYNGKQKGKFRFWREQGQISLGIQWQDKGWTSLGFFTEKGSYEGPRVIFPEKQEFIGRGIICKTRFDNLDRLVFPTKGFFWNVEGMAVNSYWGDHRSFTLFSTQWESHFSVTSDLTVSSWCRFGLSHGDVPLPYLFRIGGPETLPGFRREEVWGKQSTTVGTDVRLQFEKFFIFRVGFVGSNVWEKIEKMDVRGLKWGVTLGTALRTPFGPIALDWGLATGNRSAFYLTMGYEL